MKDNKKTLLERIEKLFEKGSKQERKVMNLALQKLDTGDYTWEDNFVYTKDRKRLVYVLGDRTTIAIPEGVEVIEDRAVIRKKHLTSLTLPSTLRKIGRDAFSDCDMLAGVVIPASVEQIEAYAFADCDNLKKVYFESMPKEVSRKAFDDCDKLHSISVPEKGVKAMRKFLHMGGSDTDDIVSGRLSAEHSIAKAEKTPKAGKASEGPSEKPLPTPKKA